MFCKYCGNQIEDQSQYCQYCGKALQSSKKTIAIGTPDTYHIRDVSSDKLHSRREGDAQGSSTAYSGRFTKPDTNEQQVKPTGLGRRILHMLYVVILICGFLYSINPDNNILNIWDMRKAYKYSKEVIGEQILTTDYQFPRFEPEFVTQRSQEIVYENHKYRVYTVSAYVYAKNYFGTRMKVPYIVKIGLPADHSVDGYYYEIVSFENF